MATNKVGTDCTDKPECAVDSAQITQGEGATDARGACDGHHHHHGLWERISAYFPRFDIDGGKRFFFREQQWRMPTLLAQVLAIVATGQKSRANLDKKMVYEFLQTEILQLSAVQDSALVINVRSITAIEFMLYEIMRLRQAELEEQTADR